MSEIDMLIQLLDSARVQGFPAVRVKYNGLTKDLFEVQQQLKSKGYAMKKQNGVWEIKPISRGL